MSAADHNSTSGRQKCKHGGRGNTLRAVRYNLIVQDLHTYLVGSERWVVHNCGVDPAATAKDRKWIRVYRAVKGEEKAQIEAQGHMKILPNLGFFPTFGALRSVAGRNDC